MLAFMASGLWLAWPGEQGTGPEDRPGTVPGSPGHKGDTTAPGAPSGSRQEGPVRDGKFKERPGPEEVAKSRYQRQRRELVEKIDELKKGGLGDVHPAVRSVAQALEKLDAEQGVGP